MIRRCAEHLKAKGMCFLGIISLVVVCLFLGRHVDMGRVCAYFQTLSCAHPYLSIGLFFALQLAVVLLGVLPASMSVVGAGIVFGVTEGFFIAAPAVLLGSVIAFGLSRSLLRGTVARLCGQYCLFRALEDAITQKGWKAVCLLRLSPILPFALTNYAIGFTKVSFRAYFVGTLFLFPRFWVMCLLVR